MLCLFSDVQLILWKDVYCVNLKIASTTQIASMELERSKQCLAELLESTVN